MKYLFTSVVLASVVAVLPVHAGGDAAAGKAKAASCTACHGPDGNSPVPTFPRLAGQHAAYLAKQLTEFKNGDRKDPTMTGMVAPLSEQDILDLAAYFASQTGAVGQAAEDKVALGEVLFKAGNAETGVSACAGCHGPAGKGNPMANFPSLSGQHAPYTTDQLNKFRSKARANDAGSMMRGVAGRMTDAEIEAVAQYIQGLH